MLIFKFIDLSPKSIRYLYSDVSNLYKIRLHRVYICIVFIWREITGCYKNITEGKKNKLREDDMNIWRT